MAMLINTVFMRKVVNKRGKCLIWMHRSKQYCMLLQLIYTVKCCLSLYFIYMQDFFLLKCGGTPFRHLQQPSPLKPVT